MLMGGRLSMKGRDESCVSVYRCEQRELSAWKEKLVKSAMLPTGLLCHCAPKAWAESAHTAILPMACCILFADLNIDFLEFTIS